MLQVRGENDGLVASFTRKLNTEIPGIESNEDEVEVLGGQVLGSECIESGDSVSKGTSVSNMFPSQSCQARTQGSNGGVNRLNKDALVGNLLKCGCVNQDPTKLNNLGRVLRYINAVLIAGSRNMNHDIAIDV
jgi:hypothetical protein